MRLRHRYRYGNGLLWLLLLLLLLLHHRPVLPLTQLVGHGPDGLFRRPDVVAAERDDVLPGGGELRGGEALRDRHEDLALDAGEDAVAGRDRRPVLVDLVQHQGVGIGLGRRPVAHLEEEALGAAQARVDVVLEEAAVFLWKGTFSMEECTQKRILYILLLQR